MEAAWPSLKFWAANDRGCHQKSRADGKGRKTAAGVSCSSVSVCFIITKLNFFFLIKSWIGTQLDWTPLNHFFVTKYLYKHLQRKPLIYDLFGKWCYKISSTFWTKLLTESLKVQIVLNLTKRINRLRFHLLLLIPISWISFLINFSLCIPILSTDIQ